MVTVRLEGRDPCLSHCQDEVVQRAQMIGGSRARTYPRLVEVSRERARVVQDFERDPVVDSVFGLEEFIDSVLDEAVRARELPGRVRLPQRLERADERVPTTLLSTN